MKVSGGGVHNKSRLRRKCCELVCCRSEQSRGEEHEKFYIAFQEEAVERA